MIDKIHDIVLNDRRLKVREISETVNISVGRVLYGTFYMNAWA